MSAGRSRGPRAKRPPRAEKGKRIIFRLTDDEDVRLRAEAGELSVSGYIRSRVFGGGARNRDALRKIAALHIIGRQVQRLCPETGTTATRPRASTMAEIVERMDDPPVVSGWEG